MSAFSDYSESTVGNVLLRGATYTGGPVYVAMFTSDPTDAAVGSEVADSDYVRQVAHKTTVDDGFVEGPIGTFKNVHDIEFPAMVDATVIVTHTAIFDAPVNGNMITHAELAKPRTYDVDDIARFPAGKLIHTFS